MTPYLFSNEPWGETVGIRVKLPAYNFEGGEAAMLTRSLDKGW